MVVGVGLALVCASPVVVRRKDTANEGDDGNAMLTAVTQPIDIPPEITTRLDELIESRCAIRVAAASRPESAAIGTPAPGCTLPPARNSPGSCDWAEGL